MEQNSLMFEVRSNEQMMEYPVNQKIVTVDINSSSSYLKSFQGAIAIEYDIQKEKRIKFLLDYSNAIMQYKINDEKIRKWQTENREELKKLGIESEFLLSVQNENFDKLSSTDSNPLKAANPKDTEDGIFKLKLNPGNFLEHEILKNLGVRARKPNSKQNLISDNINVPTFLNNDNGENFQILVNNMKSENPESSQSDSRPMIGNKRRKREDESGTQGNGSPRGKRRKKNEVSIPTESIVKPEAYSTGSNNNIHIPSSNLIQFEVTTGNINSQKEQQNNLPDSPIQKENINKETSSLHFLNNNNFTSQHNYLTTNLNPNNSSNGNLYSNLLQLQNTSQPHMIKDIFSVDDSLSIANSRATEGYVISHLSSSKAKKENNLLLINTMNNFNDEAFESVIKEFLNITEFPSDPKEKVNILKRFIPLYKKIKGDKSKLGNFIKKISDKLNENFDEINSLFDFEYLRNKREGCFANLSKIINKFSNCLMINRITNLKDESVIFQNQAIKDKYEHLQNKITDYLVTYREIFKFFEKENSDQESIIHLIDKFIPSFKLSKFLAEEGKEKIIKKIKESFDKNNITYEDSIFNLMIPKDKNDPWESLTNNFNEYLNSEQLFSLKAFETGDETFQNVFFNTYIEESRMKTKNEANSPIQEDSLHKNSGSQVSQHSLANVTPAPIIENYSGKNEVVNNNFYNLGVYYISTEGVKLPVISRKYLVKQYNKADFPDEE